MSKTFNAEESQRMDQLYQVIQTLSEQSEEIFHGRGIVICGGGAKYFPGVWVCINILRRLGCKLPIELWYLGPHEINDVMRELIEPLQVDCIDAQRIREKYPVRILNGWELKPYAIIHSRFREVLLLDADNVPIVDPTYLFDAPQYKERGAVFWPDRGRLGRERRIWSLTDVAYRDEPEFESGQILVDKQSCWKELSLTMWFNEYSDFWYRYIHGDKETFHMAWRKVNRPYAMPSRGVYMLSGTMCQHDFDGRRVFQHRGEPKWSIPNNRRIIGFELEDQCLKFLEELAGQWSRITCMNVYCEKEKTRPERDLAGVLTAARWIYERVGYDKRIMSFKSDGSIGEGAAGLEVTWDIRRQQEEFVLDIQSHDALTCRLKYGADGIWRGRWENHERMPIELIPFASSPKTISNSHPMEAEKDYSQYGEQKFILDFFSREKCGYFIDIGASDGMNSSNTYALFLRGWKGTLIEPVPEEFWHLQDNYSGAHGMDLINAAITDRDGYGWMWVADSKSNNVKDNRHTLDPQFAEQAAIANQPAKYHIREVRLISTDALAARLERQAIDFLSVDAEGLDAKIICALLNKGLRPNLIMSEMDKSNEANKMLETALKKKHYIQAFQNHVNTAWKLNK